jgi:hypothetical protein
MKKYNRDKRARSNARIRNIHTHDTCDAHDKYKRIRIHIHYDGYNHTEYIPIIYGKTRNNKAQTYVNITNAINDIFPEINAPHTAHTYRATAPYHKFILQETEYTRPEPEPDTIYEDTRTVKCIIMNDNEDIIYIGMMRRTRTVNRTQGKINIMLRKGKRTMQAYERAVDLDRIIHTMTIREIKAHDVEIYYI